MLPSLQIVLRLGAVDAPRLSRRAYRVLFALHRWRHEHRRTHRWPMQAEIASMAGLTVTSVKRAIAELVQHHVLRVEREHPRGRNTYRFNSTHEWRS